VWALGDGGTGTYPKTAAGLVACYVAGVPFFWNTLADDAFYAALLFGGLVLAERLFRPFATHGRSNTRTEPRAV
jgi:hypothetical protein